MGGICLNVMKERKKRLSTISLGEHLFSLALICPRKINFPTFGRSTEGELGPISLDRCWHMTSCKTKCNVIIWKEGP